MRIPREYIDITLLHILTQTEKRSFNESIDELRSVRVGMMSGVPDPSDRGAGLFMPCFISVYRMLINPPAGRNIPLTVVINIMTLKIEISNYK